MIVQKEKEVHNLWPEAEDGRRVDHLPDAVGQGLEAREACGVGLKVPIVDLNGWSRRPAINVSNVMRNWWADNVEREREREREREVSRTTHTHTHTHTPDSCSQ